MPLFTFNHWHLFHFTYAKVRSKDGKHLVYMQCPSLMKFTMFTLCLSTMGRKKANWFFSWPGRGVKYYIKFLRKKFLHKTIIYHWLSIYYNSVASKFKKKAISFCITLLSIFLDIQNTLNYSIIKACVLYFLSNFHFVTKW